MCRDGLIIYNSILKYSDFWELMLSNIVMNEITVCIKFHPYLYFDPNYMDIDMKTFAERCDIELYSKHNFFF